VVLPESTIAENFNYKFDFTSSMDTNLVVEPENLEITDVTIFKASETSTT